MAYKFDKILFGNHPINGKNKKKYRNAKQFSIFFLSENCFENNCPNTLGLVFCFQKLFSKIVCQTLFNEKTTENGFLPVCQTSSQSLSAALPTVSSSFIYLF
jgi:hypothetical protein